MSRSLGKFILAHHERTTRGARERRQTYHQARRAARVDQVITQAQRDRARAAAASAATWNRMRRCTPMHVGSWRRLERELGGRLTPTARDVLGLVRRAVQRGNSGILLTIEQIAHKLGRCRKSIERATCELERRELVVRIPQFVTAPRDWRDRHGGGRQQRQIGNVIVLGPKGRELAQPGAAKRRACRLSPPDKLSGAKTSGCTTYNADDRAPRGRRTGTAKPFAAIVTPPGVLRTGGKESAPVSPTSREQSAAKTAQRRDREAHRPEAPEGEGAQRDALASFAALCPGLSAALGVSVTGEEGPPEAPPGASGGSCASNRVTDEEIASVTVTRDGHGHAVTEGGAP